jgi:AcrR family transcriptional regulator
MVRKSPGQVTTQLPARRRTRRGEETRRALLHAAIRCLNDLGYGGTTVETVMARAGVSRGSVLNQFPTRLALMAAAAEAAMQAMIEDGRRRAENVTDPVERYRAACDRAWETQNLPEGVAVTELLLASRRDPALAHALQDIARRIEREIDLDTENTIRAAGVPEEHFEECIVHGRILILALRGITLELMFDRDREIIHRALSRIRLMHALHCDEVLGVSPPGP